MESAKTAGVFHPGKEAPKFVQKENLIQFLPQLDPVGGTLREKAFMKFLFHLLQDNMLEN